MPVLQTNVDTFPIKKGILFLNSIYLDLTMWFALAHGMLANMTQARSQKSSGLSLCMLENQSGASLPESERPRIDEISHSTQGPLCTSIVCQSCDCGHLADWDHLAASQSASWPQMSGREQGDQYKCLRPQECQDNPQNSVLNNIVSCWNCYIWG